MYHYPKKMDGPYGPINLILKLVFIGLGDTGTTSFVYDNLAIKDKNFLKNGRCIVKNFQIKSSLNQGLDAKDGYLSSLWLEEKILKLRINIG